MATTLWNDKPIFLHRNKERTALTIRTAREGDNPAGVFSMDQLEDLYATACASGLPVQSLNFVLYGKERRADGSPIAIPAAVKSKYNVKENGEPTGEVREGNFAYSPEQLNSFQPVSFIVKMKFIKINGRNIPAPLFMAHAAPFERSATDPATLGFQRVTAHKVMPAAETVQRKAAVRR